MSTSMPNPDGCFIERFLAQIEKARGDTTSVFHNKKGHLQLLGTAIDLFVAGTDTTTTQLEWCVMYLVMYPDMQERCRNNLLYYYVHASPDMTIDACQLMIVFKYVQDMV